MSLPLLILTLLSAAALSFTEIRSTETRSDGRPLILLDEFGFTHRGQLELNVTNLSLSGPTPDPPELSKVGFFLCTIDAWAHVLQQIEDAQINCVLGSNAIKKVFTFDRLPTPSAAAFNFSAAGNKPSLQSLVSEEISRSRRNLGILD